MIKKIIALFFFSMVPTMACAQSAIHFHDVTYDFGMVRRDDKMEHVFEFVNNGDADLVVEKVSAS
jgi:hypothetical protein